MKILKTLVSGIAIIGLLSACSENQSQFVRGAYQDSFKFAEQYMDQAVETWRDSDLNLCDLSDEQWANFVGGLSTGTAITGALAGDSIIVLLTSAGGIAVIAPAVATGVTVASGTVAATYAGIKGYCQL